MNNKPMDLTNIIHLYSLITSNEENIQPSLPQDVSHHKVLIISNSFSIK